MEVHAILIGMSCLGQWKPRSEGNEDVKVCNAETCFPAPRLWLFDSQTECSNGVEKKTSYVVR